MFSSELSNDQWIAAAQRFIENTDLDTITPSPLETLVMQCLRRDIDPERLPAPIREIAQGMRAKIADARANVFAPLAWIQADHEKMAADKFVHAISFFSSVLGVGQVVCPDEFVEAVVWSRDDDDDDNNELSVILVPTGASIRDVPERAAMTLIGYCVSRKVPYLRMAIQPFPKANGQPGIRSISPNTSRIS